MCKRKRRKIDGIDQPTCIHYTVSLYHQFSNFIDNDWNMRGVYQSTDFIDMFNLTRHLATHYLYKVFTLNEHRLFRVKKHNKSYYIKRECPFTLEDYINNEKGVVDAISQVEQFKRDGVKISIDK